MGRGPHTGAGEVNSYIKKTNYLSLFSIFLRERKVNNLTARRTISPDLIN